MLILQRRMSVFSIQQPNTVFVVCFILLLLACFGPETSPSVECRVAFCVEQNSWVLLMVNECVELYFVMCMVNPAAGFIIKIYRIRSKLGWNLRSQTQKHTHTSIIGCFDFPCVLQLQIDNQNTRQSTRAKYILEVINQNSRNYTYIFLWYYYIFITTYHKAVHRHFATVWCCRRINPVSH